MKLAENCGTCVNMQLRIKSKYMQSHMFSGRFSGGTGLSIYAT